MKMICGIALPSYAALFYKESTNPATRDMLLSQRLIHTRVYGQMIAVLSAVQDIHHGHRERHGRAPRELGNVLVKRLSG